MKVFKLKCSVTQHFDLPHQICRMESEVKSPATTDMYEANSIVWSETTSNNWYVWR